MTLKLICAFALLLVAAQAEKKLRNSELLINPRIFGGEDTQMNEFPYQISIQRFMPWINSFHHCCGGSIIHSQWILTAAHCVSSLIPGEQVFVLAGKNNVRVYENGEQSAMVDKIIIHESYDPNPNKVGPYDIALLKLIAPLSLNKFVAKISLPRPGAKPTGFCTLSGWGSTRSDGFGVSDKLQKAVLSLIDYATCKSLLSRPDGTALHPTNICTGGNDIKPATVCSGDSGGPLVQRKASGPAVIIGIVSWGLKTCGLPGAPSVFVDVAQFIDWIQAKMRMY